MSIPGPQVMSALQAPPQQAPPPEIQKALTPSSSLDVSKYAVSPGDPSAASKNWDKRADGTSKGKGFLGLLKRPDGKVSSEISIGVNIDGKELEIPTIVPTLTQPELDWLLTKWQPGTAIPKDIQEKAIAHAKQRMSAGLSPFAT